MYKFRDSQPEIRSICMAEIGTWMKKYPNMFLDDGYLKYVGWTLYDKVGLTPLVPVPLSSIHVNFTIINEKSTICSLNKYR